MKRFLQILALFLAPLILVTGLFCAALYRSHELVPTEQIEEKVCAGEASLFGLAYRDDTRTMKLAAASARKADVLVLGTSRSMQLHGEFFNTDSFYNAGGGMAYLSQAKVFLESMPADALPQHLILVLDQYFYNPHWASYEPEESAEFSEYHEPDAFYALRRMMNDYANFKFSLIDVLTNPDDIYGLTAAGRGAGFLADGAYTYGSAVLHPEKNPDAGFKDTYRRIREGRDRFEYGDMPEAASVEQTRELLRWCKERGITVTAFLPPYAPAVWHAMQETGQYTYIAKAFDAVVPVFAEYGFEVFDYSFLQETDDPQYIDGFHGSDRVYAAVCMHLAQDSAALSGMIDAQRMQALFSAEGNPQSVDFTAG